MAKKGGKQPGAGRPKGSLSKPRLSDYLTEAEVKTLVAKALEMAATGDQTMLKFILEQHFGKPVQPIGNDNDVPFKVDLTSQLAKVYGEDVSSD